MHAGIPLTLAPLDVTHKVLVTPPRNAALRAIGTPVGRAVADLTGFIDRYDPDKFGEAGVPLHDPCTIGWLLRPDLFRSSKVNLTVETDDDRDPGHDRDGLAGRGRARAERDHAARYRRGGVLRPS